MRCRRPVRRAALLAWAGAALIIAGAAQAQSAFEQGLDAYSNGEYRVALEHWRPAAESGDVVAAFNIGVLYAQGLGVEADAVEAVRWYRRAALAGYANAQFNLGAAYYRGEGAEVNVSQAVSWWEKAAEQRHAEALYNLGTLYRRGEAVPQDTRRAVSLLNEAAALGDSRARQVLADMNAPDPGAGEGGEAGRAGQTADSGAQPADSPPATVGADRGKALSDENPDHWTVQVFAGTEEGAARGFARDHGLADELRIYRAEIDGRTWFKGIYGRFADRARARAAQAELARDLPGSEPWVRSFRAIQAEAAGEVLPMGTDADGAQPVEAAVPADPDPEPATRAPSDVAGDGSGDESDSQSSGAAEAEASSPSSGSPAGGDQEALRKGQQAFNAQDYETAFAAWRPLAEKGVAEAQYGVGFMYESGWGVDADPDEAFRWYQQAAQQGHAKAQYNLGMLYRDGQGVSKNDALGLYWIQSAADRGDERAADYLKNPDR
ncbi:MAG: SPOR domain-containing protein [Gammaproteobacteria bacterium]|nr:SPOR domain-containing protein [Gammaproteobacteria bacterium]